MLILHNTSNGHTWYHTYVCMYASDSTHLASLCKTPTTSCSFIFSCSS